MDLLVGVSPGRKSLGVDFVSLECFLCLCQGGPCPELRVVLSLDSVLSCF